MDGRKTDPVERETDPVKQKMGDSTDLHGVVTWEPRTKFDRLAVTLYRLGVGGAKAIVVLLAFVILLGVGGLSTITDPAIGLLTAISAIPALALAGYVWYGDVTTSEPLSLLVATFLLAILTASFAAVLNGVLRPFFEPIGFVGMVVFFFVVVGPVEETVKLLAVGLYAYNDDRFDAVIDGAVYGAVAGLGFATIENAIFIARNVGDPEMVMIGLDLIGTGGQITTIRALAGPGHVVYSAFAGYYLGLAKFNPQHRGPIVIKGVIIAALIHATYNSTVGIASGVIQFVTGLPSVVSFFVFVVLYVGFFGALLFRKCKRYSDAYADAETDPTVEASQTESGVESDSRVPEE